MPQSEPSLYSWLLGALAAGILVIVGLYFSGILSTLREVAGELKALVKELAAQRTDLELVKQQVGANTREIASLRERQHELAAAAQTAILRAAK